MMTLIKRAILMILLCLPSFAQAQMGLPSSGGFVMIIHCGPRSADDALVKRLAVLFTQKGYSVQFPVTDQDKVNGPGVDYYTDQARPKAQDVATALNTPSVSGLPVDPNKTFQPRKQSSKRPPNYLDVWLF